MKKHRTHQIDTEAQLIFGAAIPRTWVYNRQENDYAKDYLVEIGEDDGELSGRSFYVQLKGQKAALFSADGRTVKFQLESKYAAYYDKVQELPVFLVVVDIGTRKAYYQFLQPVLLDQSWRKQNSITINIPASNELGDKAKFRQAIEGAKQTMRLLHPVAIHDAITAQKARLREMDPRFDVGVTLVDEKPVFTFRALEPVSGRLEFRGNPEELKQKLSDLLDKGQVVNFLPGEVKATGSKLFEQLEVTGGSMQWGIDLPTSFSVVCLDASGRELSRLADIPGRLTGGRKEQWFEGGLAASPLGLKLGPTGDGQAGSCKINWKLAHWGGQRLRHLASFDQLFPFGKALAASSQMQVEGWHQGNRFFMATATLHKTEVFAGPFTEYVTLLDKARKVAAKFGINPVWSPEAFDADARDTAEELYAICFEGGRVRKMPGVTLNASCRRETFKFESLEQLREPTDIRTVANWTYTFMGERVEVGWLAHDYTAMTAAVEGERPGRRKKKGDVQLILKGTEGTVQRIHQVDDPASAALPGTLADAKLTTPPCRKKGVGSLSS